MLALCLVLPVASQAAESAAVVSARATVTLVSDTDRIAPGVPFRAGLRLLLAPGWHTYWQNPGDAGIPAELTLTLPAGAAAGPIIWPAPDRLMEGVIATYAYTGELFAGSRYPGRWRRPDDAARRGELACVQGYLRSRSGQFYP